MAIVTDTTEVRPTRHPNWGSLPGKVALENEFLRGATYAQLGRKYGVRPQTVLGTMKRRAKRAGTPWPLKQGTHLHQQRLGRVCGETRWDSITASMIRLELDNAIKTMPDVTLRRIAARAKVGERTVYETHSGARPRISRKTAQKIMRVIEALEMSHQRDTTAA
jgi:hypothetical protein